MISPRIFQRICGYLECRGHRGLCNKFKVAFPSSEAHWFWLLGSQGVEESRSHFQATADLRLAFAPGIAHILLSHHAGSKALSGELVSMFKANLGQAGFEAEFKAKFLRIMAFCALFKAQGGFSKPGTPPPVRELVKSGIVALSCIDHICSSVHVSARDIASNMYSEILLLELSSICDGDVSMQSAYEEALVFLQTDLGIQAMPTTTTTTTTTPTPTITTDTPGRGEEGLVAELDLGLALELENIRSDLSSSLKLQCSKSVMELVNTLPSSAALPPALARARLPKPQKLVFKSKGPRDGHVPATVSDFWELLRVCLGALGWHHMGFILEDARVAWRCSSWILAKAMLLAAAPERLVRAYFEADGSTDVLEASMYCEALKQCHGTRSSGPLAPRITLRVPADATWTQHPSAKLYYLEHAALLPAPDDQFLPIYAALGEEDFVSYFRGLSEGLLSRQAGDPASSALGRPEELETSLLLCQKWDLDDIPPSFTLRNADDALYAIIRDSEDFSVLRRLQADLSDPASAFVVQLKLNQHHCHPSDALSAGVKLWNKTDSIESKLRLIKAIEVAGRQQGNASRTLTALAKQYQSTLLWKRGDFDRAARVIIEAAALVDDDTRACNAFVHNSILLQAAKYAWKSRRRPASHIRAQFLDRISMSTVPLELRAKAAHCFAAFFDEQYQRLSSSELLHSRRKLLAQSQKELADLNRFLHRATPKDLTAFETNRKILEGQVAQDLIEIENILADREQYALRAAESYVQALASGDKYDLTVFRLCALWFSFKKLPSMNRIIDSSLMPLRKILPLMYQLAARCEKSELVELDSFQTTLQRLLWRAVVEHPLHSLHQLLALRAMGAAVAGSKRRLVVSGSLQERRSAAAASIIAKAKSTGDGLRELIADTEKLWMAYIEMANHEVPLDTSTKVVHPFEARWLIRTLHDLSCPVPTCTVPVGISYTDDEVDRVAGFVSDGYRVVGGINMPKIIECRGSSGRRHRQLVKGKDDVRQVSHSSPSP